MASEQSAEKFGNITSSGEDVDQALKIEPVASTSGTSEEVAAIKTEDEGDGSGRDSPFSMSLDVLAQVASDRLQTEPPKAQLASLIPKKLTKRSVQCLDLLNLEQICIVSDKILINMFAEMNSDEIKRNYTYTCQLMPDKCQQSFCSFGNESRAKNLVKAHLYQHIAALKKEAKGNPEFDFYAEPIHARRKRLTAEKLAEKKKRKIAMKALAKKSPNQNLFTSIRAERSTMYDPRNRRTSSSSSTPAVTGVAQAGNKKGKKSSGSASRKQMGKMKLVQVVFPTEEDQALIDSLDSKPNLEESAMSDIDVVDTPPQAEDIAAEEVVSENQTTSEEQAIWVQMCRKEPYQDHSYTTVFGSFQKYVYNRSAAESGAADEGSSSSRTAGVKAPQEDTAMDEGDAGRQIMLRVNTGEPANNDLFIPIIRLPGYDEAAGSQSPKVEQPANSSPGMLEYSHNALAEPYPPMPKSELARRGRVAVPDELSDSSEEDPATGVKSKKRILKKNSVEWERRMALQCIRQLRGKKKQGSDTLICKICRDKSFTATATLLYHYRSHAGIKPFVCLICNTTFTRQHSLNYHMLIHNNQSRFTCLDCGRKFRHPSHFKEHLRRHTGETPFHCTDCPLRFKTRNTYKRHLKTRHGKLLTANGIRFMPREEFLKICSRSYNRAQDDSDFDEDEEVEEDEEIEDAGGVTIPAPTSSDPGSVEGEGEGEAVAEGEGEGEGEEGTEDDPAEFPQGCVDEGGSPVSVEEAMSASNKLLELCSQVVKQEAG